VIHGQLPPRRRPLAPGRWLPRPGGTGAVRAAGAVPHQPRLPRHGRQELL